MPANYDFKNISPWEFERLVRDVLSRYHGFEFEAFKPGKDGGVDLRYSLSFDNHIVVQCKHYVSSPYRSLKRAVKEELPKIKFLQPTRYILVTSLGLTPGNKSELADMLLGYLNGYEDIVTRDTLNGWLSEYPDIEKNYFNLWACSASVMERIVHSGIFNYSSQQISNIKRKINLYVKTPAYNLASDILESQRFCIIAGMPGIGKTTLAEMLLIDYMERGCQPFKISSDIEEAFSVYNVKENFIFYYDDFLGQTGLDEKLNKNEDRRIAELCELCSRSKNAFFIMTTREYILNKAKTTYEVLERSGVDYRKCVIDIGTYNNVNRAQLLYNHLYYSDVPDEYKKAVVDNEVFMDVVLHKSFNPRVIEFMTSYAGIQKGPAIEYVSAIKEALNKPYMVWDHAYKYQIADCSRHLLMILVSLPSPVFLNDCRKSFEVVRNIYCGIFFQKRESNEFEMAVKECEGNFVEVYSDAGGLVIKFHNPSVRDYMSYCLSEDYEAVKVILQSSISYDQLVGLWNSFHELTHNPLVLCDDLAFLFQEKILELIESDNFRLHRCQTFSGKVVLEYNKSSLIRRCSFFLSLDFVPVLPCFKEKACGFLYGIFEDLDKVYLWGEWVDLLKSMSLSKDRLDLDFEFFLKSTLDILANKLYQIDDFRHLAELCEFFPEAHDRLNKQYGYFMEVLLDMVDDEIDYVTSVDEVGVLEDMSYSLNRVNNIFGGGAELIIQRIDDMLWDLKTDNSPYLSEVKAYSFPKNNNDEEEIVNMFKTLI